MLAGQTMIPRTDHSDPPAASPGLRLVEPRDVPAILAMIEAIFREYNLVLNVEHDDVHLKDPPTYFRSQGGEFWVVEDSGRIVATGGVTLHDDAGELKGLYVDPTVRQQGWGRRLTELAMDFARRAGKRRFVLWSDTRFTRAHRLYRSMGFTPIGERPLYDSNNSIEYGFERAL